MNRSNSLIDRLNKIIEIQEKTIISDKCGGFVENWVLFKKIWAEIKPISSFTTFEINKIDEKVSHIITIRYLENFQNDYRIVYKNRIFNIQGVINPFEENKLLEIKVEEAIL